MSMEMDIAPNKAEQVALMARELGRAEPELRAFLQGLNIEEKASLVALVWLGRGTFEASEYSQARDLAKQEATTPAEDYLLQTPNLAFDIEAGLELLGFDVSAEAEAVMGR